MQVPRRRGGKFSQQKPDALITRQKFDELERELAHLKKIRPAAAADVSQLAELGDFSENVEYQLAKGRLRGINNAMLKLEAQINQATIIEPIRDSDTVQVGNKVTFSDGKAVKTFLILGSEEADPEHNIISRNSPIGSALLGHEVGETVMVQLANRKAEYKILKIE